MKLKTALLTLLAALLLLFWMVAIPSGTITDEADERYQETEELDDEYDFL